MTAIGVDPATCFHDNRNRSNGICSTWTLGPSGLKVSRISLGCLTLTDDQVTGLEKPIEFATRPGTYPNNS
jgi:hypothetical protein